MKTRQVFDFETMPVSLRSAWDMRRAWRPTWLSPISPSSSARGNERRDRVDDDDVDRAGADEHLRDLEGLLAAVGLRDEEVVDVDAELPGVLRVERVLRVDERREAAELLRLGDDVERERRLARRLGAEDLDDAAAGHAADAESRVDADRSGRDGGDADHLALAEPHDGSLAELPLDLRQSGLGCFHFFRRYVVAHLAIAPEPCPM